MIQNTDFVNARLLNVDTNVTMTLQALSNIVLGGDTGVCSSEQIVQVIDGLAKQNMLTIVGKGTNRIAVSINGDMTPYVGRNDVVIKIPYSTKKGIDDNLRELLLYSNLSQNYATTQSVEMAELLDRLPAVMPVQGFPILIAQERVERIEDYIARSLQIKNYNTYTMSDIAKDIILGDNFIQSYLRLMSLLEKYCIFADLNPLVTPFQFGLKKAMNGQTIITVLDTGYTIPKFSAFFNLPGDFSKYKYILIGRDITTKSIMDDRGNVKKYLLSSNPDIEKNLNKLVHMITETVGAFINPDRTSFTDDMTYFKMVYRALYGAYRNFDNDPALINYFNSLFGHKLSSKMTQ